MSGFRVNIRVTGEKELRRALRKLSEDSTWKTELRAVHKAAAEEAVTVAKQLGGQTRRNIAGGPARLGSKGLSSIRALASQTKATIAGGSASVPWYGGSDFGAQGGPRTRQFPPANKSGYIIYPAIEQAMPEIIRVYREGIDRLTGKYFNK